MNSKFRILYYFVFLFFLSGLSFACMHTRQRIRVVRVPLVHASDIRPVNDSLIVPYVYTNVVSLKGLPLKEKKEKFFQMLLPAVVSAKTEMAINRKRVIQIMKEKHPAKAEVYFLDSLKSRYKTSSTKELVNRLHSVPVSIVLAQAAIESGWGSSRFFLKANNPFGIWSFDAKHNRIEADSNRNGKKVYLRKFDDLEEAIDEYFIMIATRKPFARLQKACIKTQDPYKLVPYLNAYSERGADYTKDLSKMIRTNHLEKYDQYRIRPDYLL